MEFLLQKMHAALMAFTSYEAKVFVVFAISVVVMMVTACRRGGVCPYLQRRRCLFGRSAEEVAGALLVGSEDPRDNALELSSEVQGLRRVVQRLAGTVMWDRVSPAATAVAEEIARDKP